MELMHINPYTISLANIFSFQQGKFNDLVPQMENLLAPNSSKFLLLSFILY